LRIWLDYFEGKWHFTVGDAFYKGFVVWEWPQDF